MVKNLPKFSYKLLVISCRLVLLFSFFFAVFNFVFVNKSYSAEVVSDKPYFAEASQGKPYFVKVEELKVGDLVFSEGEGQLNADKIVEKKWVGEPTDVYNLTVGGDQTYFANGLAVHNKGSTTHYAYYFFDNLTSGTLGYHDSGETTLGGGLAYANFYNNYINAAEELCHDVFCCKLNNDGCVTKVEGVAAAAKEDFTRGDTFRAVPQTRRGSPYYVGGVKFKDYDGRPRSVYRYTRGCADFEGSGCYCRDWNKDYNRPPPHIPQPILEVSDWKPEKDYDSANRQLSGYVYTTKGIYASAEQLFVQVAEFNVDYNGTYFLSLAMGRDLHYAQGAVLIYDITGVVLRPLPNWRFEDFYVTVLPWVLGRPYGSPAPGAVCYGADSDTYCNLRKDRDYAMIFTASGSLRGGEACLTPQYWSGVPFLFWQGGQELTGGWYGDNRTSAIPIANLRPTISGRVYNDANLNCADNLETGVANATIYLDSWGSNPEPTDSTGSFILDNVTAGEHKVYIQPASDYVVEDCTATDTTLKFDLVGGSRRYYKTVTVSGSGATVSFALVRSGSIFGHVYKHFESGISCASLGGSGSEALQGVRVYSDQGPLTATTNDEGYFKLNHAIDGEEIPVGIYVLNVDNLPEEVLADNIKYCPTQSITMTGTDIEVKIGLLSSVAWWQATGGDIHANSGGITSIIPPSITCTGLCKPYLMLNDVSGQPGVVSWQSGSLDLGDQVSVPDNVSEESEDWRAMAGSYQGTIYNYSFWQYNLGDEEGIETLSSGSLPNPGETKIYEATGDLDIEGDVDANSKVIVLHDKGSGTRVKITGDIEVTQGGFLVVITNGNIEIDDSVENLQGIFIADGTISFGSEDNTTPLTVEGSLIGWQNINLSGRDFGDERNNSQPTLKFIYRPDLMIEAPEVIRRPQYRWQEIVP